MVYTWNRILSSFERDENFAKQDKIDKLEGIIPNETNQSEKDKYCLIAII